MQVTEKYNILMFTIRTDFAVDSAWWMLGGGVPSWKVRVRTWLPLLERGDRDSVAHYHLPLTYLSHSPMFPSSGRVDGRKEMQFQPVWSSLIIAELIWMTFRRNWVYVSLHENLPMLRGTQTPPMCRLRMQWSDTTNKDTRFDFAVLTARGGAAPFTANDAHSNDDR